jgi:histidyl-tRNA synthetase
LVEYFSSRKDELCDTCKSRLLANPLRILDCKSPICSGIAKDAPKTIDHLCDECKDHFEGLKARLNVSGIDYQIDCNIVRGLDYYSRTVFEFISEGIGSQSTVCGGGRYDNLTGIFGLPNMSGVGISFGADRIYDVLKGLDKFPSEVTSTTKLLFANMGSEELKYLIPVVRTLREAGVPCEIYPEQSKLKKQFDYADKKAIPFLSIVGGNEVEAGIINIKNLSTGEQKSFDKDNMTEILEFLQ